ncbi:ABC-three component system middle component 6 [Campylobacter jejuni]
MCNWGIYFRNSFARKKAIDDLYSEFSRIYPKKISFETFMYAIDFLYMIKKLRIIKEDILEIII